MKFKNKTTMLNMPSKKKCLFLVEYSDKTLLRNTISFEMGYLSNFDWRPKSTFAEDMSTMNIKASTTLLKR
jgi:hypothetical protein